MGKGSRRKKANNDQNRKNKNHDPSCAENKQELLNCMMGCTVYVVGTPQPHSGHKQAFQGTLSGVILRDVSKYGTEPKCQHLHEVALRRHQIEDISPPFLPTTTPNQSWDDKLKRTPRFWSTMPRLMWNSILHKISNLQEVGGSRSSKSPQDSKNQEDVEPNHEDKPSESSHRNTTPADSSSSSSSSEGIGSELAQDSQNQTEEYSGEQNIDRVLTKAMISKESPKNETNSETGNYKEPGQKLKAIVGSRIKILTEDGVEYCGELCGYDLVIRDVEQYGGGGCGGGEGSSMADDHIVIPGACVASFEYDR